MNFEYTLKIKIRYNIDNTSEKIIPYLQFAKIKQRKIKQVYNGRKIENKNGEKKNTLSVFTHICNKECIQ